ncbi:ArsR/SmtB family transcription factor [Desulfosporosinus youngiae]|uniref:Putative transcriptional regulator n=1 Tax=Desulfosporosinus youngiae DSM 17734 TaxID=768710 RepID=H5XXJ0_9FIRM|nr:metalloregulator ArsR/SmtB family transcription factor [Desulfosporosinus youngiae]EHQ91196.1 putative transcriptional regulator [Desulfosporosinus youngiae DSM 17734]
MKYSYAEYVLLFKAIADQTRLNIVDLLSCGEMCACQLLDNFKITQPTLSYHMRILCDSGIVKGRREGAWMYYSINGEAIETIAEFISKIKSKKDKSINQTSTDYDCKRDCKINNDNSK